MLFIPKALSSSRPFDFKKALNETGFDIQDLLRECRWQDKPCGAENFTSFIDLQVQIKFFDVFKTIWIILKGFKSPTLNHTGAYWGALGIFKPLISTRNAYYLFFI